MRYQGFTDRRGAAKKEAVWIAGTTNCLGRRLGLLIDTRGYQIANGISFGAARCDYPELNIREWDANVGYVNVGRRSTDDQPVAYDYTPDVAA